MGSFFAVLSTVAAIASASPAQRPSPLLFTAGRVVARGFEIHPYTSAPLRCAPGERTVGYDVAAARPFALADSQQTGAVLVFRSAGRNPVTVTVTAIRRQAIAADVSRRYASVEVLCER